MFNIESLDPCDHSDGKRLAAVGMFNNFNSTVFPPLEKISCMIGLK